ncbi:MAG: helix-turn-helix domain-containing protein [Ignavibacteria bacterium]|nr:helix-turn-helix domain-containing protein [Ignavibacteria bacterium]
MDKGQLKRQIEILAMCLPDKRSKIEVRDLAQKFGTGEVTINRDLSDLRNLGVDIHSEAKKGIVISGEAEQGIIQGLLNKYVGTYYSDNLEEIIKKQIGVEDCVKFFEKLVLLNMAIETGTKAEIKVRNRESSLLTEPVLIRLLGNDWILFSKSGDEFMHFKIGELISVRSKESRTGGYSESELEKYIERLSKPADIPRHIVKLKFAKPLNGRFPKEIIHTVISEVRSNGELIIKGECRSLEELADWIIINGGLTQKIFEPESLLEIVLQKANHAIEMLKESKVLFSRSVDFNTVEECLYDSVTESSDIQYYSNRIITSEDIQYYTPSQKDFWEFPYEIAI